MKERSFGLMALVLVLAMSVSGCETLKGAGKDIENVAVGVTKAPSVMMALDAKMREALW